MNNNIPETAQLIPSDFVIIGGSGDLSVRKIIPALFWRFFKLVYLLFLQYTLKFNVISLALLKFGS